ncbi:MAG TPA: cobalamin-independent methionine synthase II family protein [Candidatus Binataceae bacterium]|nr:cobalamin-independent methionine synthase II family protein [Candidatus Binataceae bacterium]
MTVGYRADVIGSLLRPGYLKEARKDFEAGRLSAAGFKRAEDRAVDQAIALQEAAGVDVVTDGEMRRTHFISPLSDVLEGVKVIPAFKRTWRRRDSEDERGKEIEMQVQLAVVDKISRKRSPALEEFIYARARARKPLKITLPSPLMMALRYSPEYSQRAYPNPFDLFRDAADLVRQDAEELARLGCEYIQIDAPELGMLCDPERRRADFGERGMDPDRLATEGMEILDSVASVPGVTFGLHLCRGNNQGYYIGEGGYEGISKEAFKRARNYDIFLLEYDDWRSGGFEPLRDLPTDKVVVLGIVSTKHESLEARDGLIKRIEEAARYFPREQLALSTQCGFGTVWEGNPISEETQESKLTMVAELAHQFWK